MFASKDALIANAGGGYPINNSLRFRSSATAYLNRTPASASNRKTWTWSGWVKRGALADCALFQAYSDTNNRTQIGIGSNYINFTNLLAGSVNARLNTNAVYRDPSAWYHIVAVYDSTDATASNRMKLYVNGVLQTSFLVATYPAQNTDLFVNSNIAHYVGVDVAGGSFDGYLAEVNFIDGQALTASSFGAYDATTGVWQPALYTGTYGTNGFYLKFASFGTAADLGTDSSGNGNTWTVNNISVTAGTTYDPMLDSPTLTSATVANYAVINPLSSIAFPITNGNLSIGASTTSNRCTKSTFAVNSGKWYWEFKASSMSASGQIAGICSVDATFSGGLVATGYDVQYYSVNGNKYVNGTASAYGASWTTANTIGVALDVGAGTVTFYKDNVSQGSISITAGQTWVASWLGQNTTDGVDYTFGQRPFSYTPPSGFVALNTYNLPTPTIANGATCMAATTYTGTGASQTVANTVNTINFKPDLVWIKSRSAATDHKLTDSVRGTTKALISDTTGAETTDTTGLTAFGSTGFTVGADTVYNNNTATYIGWQWLAGAGSSSSNTNGSITSTVSVNATAGFSVVTYTGTGANATVGHGLGVAPSMVIIKDRIQGSAAYHWFVYHISLGAGQRLLLNTTGAGAADTNYFNNTSPTSSVFSLGNATQQVNTSGDTYVAYCWSAVAGYSAFGSYTGNGSADGPFVYTGFRPRFVMVKRTDAAGYSWCIVDTSRVTYNVDDLVLRPDTSGTDVTGNTTMDVLSNGFKVRTTWTDVNASGGTYIYAAFAENPFKYALAR
jgi:hypothetical protein